MATVHRIVTILIFIWLLQNVNYHGCYRFEPNTFTLNNITECPGDGNNTMHINFTVSSAGRNKYVFNGEIISEESSAGMVELHIVSKRCNFKMTECEVFDILNMRDICKLLDRENQLWSEFMKHSHPTLKCPFERRTYNITDALVDLGYVAHLPLDGYTWSFTIKSYKSVKGIKLKRMVFCHIFELSITKIRPGRKRN